MGDTGAAAEGSGRRVEVAVCMGSSDGVLPVRDSRVRAGFRDQPLGLGGGDDDDDAALEACATWMDNRNGLTLDMVVFDRLI